MAAAAGRPEPELEDLMQAVVGGNIRYANLQSICDQFRAQINDTANNTTGSGVGTGNQAGVIMPNSNPDLLTLLTAATQDTYAELRNVGDPELILDNYDLFQLPPVNSNLGPGSPNPAAQVALGYSGYFDGVQWWPQWTLPISMSRMLAVAQRQNSTYNFASIPRSPAGLPGVMQGTLNSAWEMRQGQLWLNGATESFDLRLRCRITFPDFLSNPTTQINFATAYVPILDSRNAIVAKMLVYYARRFAPELLPVAESAETKYMGRLRLEAIRERQSAESGREPYGDAAVQDFAVAWSWL